MKPDVIQNFVFKDRAVRGSIVCLSESYKTIINQHHYPPAVAKLLGEALLGVCLMAPFFKALGKITLQFQGEGDLKLLSARITSDFKIRGLARAEPELMSHHSLLEALRSGQLSLTYESILGEPYQSIIPIEKDEIAATLEDYFLRSEQLPTRFFLLHSAERIAGLMVQALPSAEKQNAYQDFEHCTILAATLKEDEINAFDVEMLLHRLFAEDDITVFPSKALAFGCGCTHQRMASAVVSLGHEEALSILAEQGFIEVVCEFCNQAQQFNETEIKALFSPSQQSGGLGQQSPRPHFDA